jgi:hypothetical protein
MRDVIVVDDGVPRISTAVHVHIRYLVSELVCCLDYICGSKAKCSLRSSEHELYF